MSESVFAEGGRLPYREQEAAAVDAFDDRPFTTAPARRSACREGLARAHVAGMALGERAQGGERGPGAREPEHLLRHQGIVQTSIVAHSVLQLEHEQVQIGM